MMPPHKSRKRELGKVSKTNSPQYQLENQKNDKVQPVEEHIRSN